MRALTSEHMVAVAPHVGARHARSSRSTSRASRASARSSAPSSRRRPGEKLTYLPFIIKAVVDGLKQYPVLNAAVRGNNIIYRKQYNIGIAVALDWGLIVPVIKNADDLSLTGLTQSAQRSRRPRARQEARAATKCRTATFTITNPGVFGSLMGTPIITSRTSAILGLGAIEKRPKVITGADGEDTIAIRTCAYFSLSFDHRIVDGADADKFLAFVKKTLETLPGDGALTDAARAHDAAHARHAAANGRGSSSGCSGSSDVLRAARTAASGCSRRAGLPGAFLEFFEAPDRRDARARARRRARAGARSGAHLPRSGAATDMPDSHRSPSTASTWHVFPSGRVTQNDRDEFALVFVAGTGDDARSARHALLAASARARASSRSPS